MWLGLGDAADPSAPDLSVISAVDQSPASPFTQAPASFTQSPSLAASGLSLAASLANVLAPNRGIPVNVGISSETQTFLNQYGLVIAGLALLWILKK
jgi:hypothetical protein